VILLPSARSVEFVHFDGDVIWQRPVTQVSIDGTMDDEEERVANETNPAILRQSPAGVNARDVRVEVHPEDILKA
jgi:hypothetical protein